MRAIERLEHSPAYADSEVFLARREWAALNGVVAMIQRSNDRLRRWTEPQDDPVLLLPMTPQK